MRIRKNQLRLDQNNPQSLKTPSNPLFSSSPEAGEQSKTPHTARACRLQPFFPRERQPIVARRPSHYRLIRPNGRKRNRNRRTSHHQRPDSWPPWTCLSTILSVPPEPGRFQRASRIGENRAWPRLFGHQNSSATVQCPRRWIRCSFNTAWAAESFGTEDSAAAAAAAIREVYSA
jgi:hypothetical protein